MKKKSLSYFCIIALVVVTAIVATLVVKKAITVSTSSVEFETLQSTLSFKVPTDSVFVL